MLREHGPPGARDRGGCGGCGELRTDGGVAVAAIRPPQAVACARPQAHRRRCASRSPTSGPAPLWAGHVPAAGDAASYQQSRAVSTTAESVNRVAFGGIDILHGAEQVRAPGIDISRLHAANEGEHDHDSLRLAGEQGIDILPELGPADPLKHLLIRCAIDA